MSNSLSSPSHKRPRAFAITQINWDTFVFSAHDPSIIWRQISVIKSGKIVSHDGYAHTLDMQDCHVDNVYFIDCIPDDLNVLTSVAEKLRLKGAPFTMTGSTLSVAPRYLSKTQLCQLVGQIVERANARNNDNDDDDEDEDEEAVKESEDSEESQESEDDEHDSSNNITAGRCQEE